MEGQDLLHEPQGNFLSHFNFNLNGKLAHHCSPCSCSLHTSYIQHKKSSELQISQGCTRMKLGLTYFSSGPPQVNVVVGGTFPRYSTSRMRLMVVSRHFDVVGGKSVTSVLSYKRYLLEALDIQRPPPAYRLNHPVTICLFRHRIKMIA